MSTLLKRTLKHAEAPTICLFYSLTGSDFSNDDSLVTSEVRIKYMNLDIWTTVYLFCFFSPCMRGLEFRKEGRRKWRRSLSWGRTSLVRSRSDVAEALPLAVALQHCSASSGSGPGGPAGLKSKPTHLCARGTPKQPHKSRVPFSNDRGRTNLKINNMVKKERRESEFEPRLL